MYDTYTPNKTLRDLGYYFNSDGQMRTIEDEKPFIFTTQLAYEEIGEAVTHEVYDQLLKIGLQKLALKKDSDTKPDEMYSFIFASPHFEKKKTLLVLVHGTGVVRAGQWTRKLIMNENLDNGTQIPYIKRAMKNGWGVLVTNCNNNTVIIDGERIPLQYSKNNNQHIKNAWLKFVDSAAAETIYIVAHSRGGGDVSELLAELPDEDRVKVVCLTDSWFNFSSGREQQPIVIDWAATSRKIELPPSFQHRRVNTLWAGTNQHERSSCAAIESIFHVLENNPSTQNINLLLREAHEIIQEKYSSNSAKGDSSTPPKKRIKSSTDNDNEVAAEMPEVLEMEHIESSK